MSIEDIVAVARQCQGDRFSYRHLHHLPFLSPGSAAEYIVSLVMVMQEYSNLVTCLRCYSYSHSYESFDALEYTVKSRTVPEKHPNLQSSVRDKQIAESSVWHGRI